MSTLDLTPREYADQFMQKLRALGDGRDWIFDEAGQRLRTNAAGVAAGAQSVISLASFYRDWTRRPPRARAEHLQNAAQTVLNAAIPENFQEARAKLIPIVRGASDRGEAIVLAKSGASNLLFRPICDDLEAGLAFEGPHSLIRLSTTHIASWDVSEDQAFAIALENLRSRSSRPLKEIAPDTYLSTWNDDLDSARMLLTDYMVEYVTMGTPVVMVPSKNKLLLTSDKNEAGLEQLVRHAEESVGNPRALSPLMLRLVNGQWTRFEPPGFRIRLNNLRKSYRAEQYDRQKRFLDERLRMEGREVFVANYLIGKGDEETPLMSACSWTKGVKSLLPAVDMICFADPEAGTAEGFAVHWKPVAAIAGKLMRQTNDRPPRFYVSAFPDAEQLVQLRKAAVNPQASAARPKPKSGAAKGKGAGRSERPAFEWRALLGALICWPLVWLAASYVGAIEDVWLTGLCYLGMLGLSLGGLVYAARALSSLWTKPQ
ncbi:MAG: hypothetical protein V4582_14490 [Pseudomonadota bacterium]